MRFVVRLVILLFCFACVAALNYSFTQSALAGPHLKLVRTVELDKSKGQIDQLVELPDGSFLVRDSTIEPLDAQSVELYDHTGNLTKKIGSFGQEPGHYFALAKLAFSKRSNLIWIVDRFGRVSRFDLSGKFIDSILLQKPGYHPYDIALDEDHNRYYLTGCVALHFYLNRGCQIIHEYELSTNKYLGSFLETDSEAVTKQYFALEDYRISLAPSGFIYAIDAPVRKFWRISTDRKIDGFPVPSKVMEAIPALDPSQHNSAVGDRNYLIDQIVFAEREIVLAAYRKTTDSCVLEVFSADGKPIALDMSAPGFLIGKSSKGTFWFRQRTGKGFRVAEYSF